MTAPGSLAQQTPPRVVPVPFAGPGGSGPMTWGQERIATLAEQLHPWSEMHQDIDGPLPPGLTVDDVCATLRAVIEHFAGLRTVFDGRRQRVLDAGTLDVTVLQTTADRLAATVADARAAVRRPVFTLADLPIRATLITVGAAPAHVVISLSHIAVDFGSTRRLEQHLIFLVTGGRAGVPLPADVHQPLDQAADEQSAAGRRGADRALRHFEAVLRAAPLTMLPRAERPVDGPRFRFLRFRSAALGRAVDALAARHRVNPTAVLHAGLCAIVGYVSSLDRALLQIIVTTRNTARTRAALGPYTQSVPTVLRLGDRPFAEVIAAAGTALLSGLFHGRHPESEMDDVRRRVEADRGGRLDLSCWINDRQGEPPAQRSEPSRSDLTPDGTWTWEPTDAVSTSSYFLHADVEADRTARLGLLFDAALIPPDEAVAWLRALELLLTRSVHDEVTAADVGLAAAPIPPGWQFVDASWVDVPAVTALVRAVSGQPDAVVEVRGERLVARLRRDPGPIRDDLLAATAGRRNLLVPHAFVIEEN